MKEDICPKCHSNGIVVIHKIINNVEVKTVAPCKICGRDHGYHEYVKSNYARQVSKVQRLEGNVYQFPTQVRAQQIYKEAAENMGVLPVKSIGNNIVELKTYRDENGKI